MTHSDYQDLAKLSEEERMLQIEDYACLLLSAAYEVSVNNGEAEMMKVYVIYGYSSINYEQGYDWIAGVYKSENKAEERIAELNEKAMDVDNRFEECDHTEKKEEFKKVDPFIEGWGDQRPRYTIYERDLID